MSMSSKADEYWRRKVASNPGLTRGDSVIKLRVSAFETEIRKAYAAGQSAGFKSGYDTANLTKKTPADAEKDSDWLSFFNQFVDGDRK